MVSARNRKRKAASSVVTQTITWGTTVFLTLIMPMASAQVSDSSRYNAPLDAVWRATIETVAESRFEVQSSDKASGAIWLQTMKGFGGDKGVLELMKVYTTKRG